MRSWGNTSAGRARAAQQVFFLSVTSEAPPGNTIGGAGAGAGPWVSVRGARAGASGHARARPLGLGLGHALGWCFEFWPWARASRSRRQRGPWGAGRMAAIYRLPGTGPSRLRRHVKPALTRVRHAYAYHICKIIHML